MEVQLVQLSRVPPGLIASSIVGESGQSTENKSTKANEVFVSVCPTGRLIAFVSSFRAQFIASDDVVCLSDGMLPTYVNSYEGLIHVMRDPLLPKPAATACIVIPITLDNGQGEFQTSSLIIIGFSDGYIRGYSKTGKTVFSQLLHSEPVISLKVLSLPQLHGRTSYKSLSSLIVLLNGRVVCVVVGDSLTEVIKGNIARSNKDSFDEADPEQQVPLGYKKFYLQEQSNISDVALLGQSTVSAFDYLREASVVGGWDMTIRSGPVPEAKLIAVGEQPMVGLYRISKDAGTLNMSEVVHAVATRMTSAVLGKLSAAGGWLNWGGGGGGAKTASAQTPTKGKSPEEKQQPKMNLPMSTNIPDPRRRVTTIVISPMGNLATLVDGFGRVMLLDVESLVIRRMWKGYREAQCGWLVVSDPSDVNTRAQCLCIYAPRRGILEFWPVQCGPRVAAFQVGKGCKLLHITRCLFGEERCLGDLPSSNSGLENRALLLSATGRLLSFSVPFPMLMKRSSPRSHDSHMLLTLDQAVSSGNQELVCDITESVKSSQALQEVLQFVINSYESSNGGAVTKQMVIKVLNIAVRKTKSLKDFTVPDELHRHCVTMRQIVSFYFSLLEILDTDGASTQPTETSMESTNTLSQLLQDSCKISFHFAERMESLLCSYFRLCEPVKRVRQVLRLTDLINCFEVSNGSVDCLLPPPPTNESSPNYAHLESLTETIALKKGMDDVVLIDLGEFIFKHFLTVSVSYHEIESLIKSSGIESDSLLTLLFQYWSCGSFCPANETLSATSLIEISNILISLIPSGAATNHWSVIQETIAHSHYPGYALLGTIICSYLSVEKALPSTTISPSSKENMRDKQLSGGEESEEEEAWESVTIDVEHWARLSEMLELLTELSLVCGSVGLKPLPLVLFIEQVEDEEMFDVRRVKIKMLFEESEGRGVCVSALTDSGPALFGHGIAKSIVSRGIPAELILEIQKGSSKNILKNIRNLVTALPNSLSVTNLLMYCSFQAALEWSNTEPTSEERTKLLSMILDNATHISSLVPAKGLCGFLWHFLLEKEITALSEAIKKRSPMQSDTSLFLWMCRSIVSFLLKSIEVSEDCSNERAEIKQDVINIESPMDLSFLPFFVHHFSNCDSDSLKMCLELILLLELIHISGAQSNVFSFFPPTFRSTWFKGIHIYRSEGRKESVQKNLQIKRMKFLNGAVSSLIHNKLLNIKPNASFTALAVSKPSALLYDFSDFSDIVFGLGNLWDLDIDAIKTHWVANLYAAGKDTIGKQVFLGIRDKDSCSVKLLSLAGHLTLTLVNRKDRQLQAMLISQSSPGLFEWMRKQASHPIVATLMSTCSLTDSLIVSNLLNMIGPHIMTSTLEKTFHNVNNLISML